jgi:tetratricopeptide (TPR) repeat protein
MERDMRLLQLELAERPEHTFTLFNLGMTLLDDGLPIEAADHLRRSLRAAKPEESHVRKAYALLVCAEERAKKWQAAWEACCEGLERFPLDDELRFRKGLLLQNASRETEAVEVYQDLLRRRETRHFTSVSSGLDGFKTRHNLALAFESLGSWPQAESQWRAILAEKPNYGPAVQSLLKIARRSKSELATTVNR